MKISDLQKVNGKFARLGRLEALFEEEISNRSPCPDVLEDIEEKMTELNSQLTLLGVDMELHGIVDPSAPSLAKSTKPPKKGDPLLMTDEEADEFTKGLRDLNQ